MKIKNEENLRPKINLDSFYVVFLFKMMIIKLSGELQRLNGNNEVDTLSEATQLRVNHIINWPNKHEIGEHMQALSDLFGSDQNKFLEVFDTYLSVYRKRSSSSHKSVPKRCQLLIDAAYVYGDNIEMYNVIAKVLLAFDRNSYTKLLEGEYGSINDVDSLKAAVLRLRDKKTERRPKKLTSTNFLTELAKATEIQERRQRLEEEERGGQFMSTIHFCYENQSYEELSAHVIDYARDSLGYDRDQLLVLEQNIKEYGSSIISGVSPGNSIKHSLLLSRALNKALRRSKSDIGILAKDLRVISKEGVSSYLCLLNVRDESVFDLYAESAVTGVGYYALYEAKSFYKHEEEKFCFVSDLIAKVEVHNEKYSNVSHAISLDKLNKIIYLLDEDPELFEVIMNIISFACRDSRSLLPENVSQRILELLDSGKIKKSQLQKIYNLTEDKNLNNKRFEIIMDTLAYCREDLFDFIVDIITEIRSYLLDTIMKALKYDITLLKSYCEKIAYLNKNQQIILNDAKRLYSTDIDRLDELINLLKNFEVNENDVDDLYDKIQESSMTFEELKELLSQ